MAKRLTLTTDGRSGASVGVASSSATLGRPAPLRVSTGRFLWSTVRRSSLSMTSSSAAWNVTAMALVRQLDERLAAIVEHPLQAPQLCFGVASISSRDLEVLALDDRSHALVDSSGRREGAATYPSSRVVDGRPR